MTIPIFFLFFFEEDVKNMKYNIHVYTVCWNEIDIVKFVVDYWNQYATKIVIYDNGSTDGTIEYLSQFENIEIRHFDTDGLDDTANMNIKNSCWKESVGIADYVVVCDFDECLFSPFLEEELDYMKENNMTLCGPVQYALQGDYYPGYVDGKFLHEIITKVRLQKSNHTPNINTYGKLMLFDPNKISDMNYGPGCHKAKPIGKVKLYDRNRILCIHINKGFGVEYNIQRKRILEKRISDENKKHGYAVHYSFSDDKIRQDYQMGNDISVNILDVLEKMNKNKEEKTNDKILIYTGLIGDYDVPYDNFQHKEGYDYVLLSDVPIETKSWENRIVSFGNGENLSPIKKARYLKTHPHELFDKNYDLVVWVDANTFINDKLYKYINKYKDSVITFKEHNDRDCVYDEIMVCAAADKETPIMALKVYDKCARSGYPRKIGLFETNIIISHYTDSRVIELMDNWWNEIFHNSHRDQLSLNYVIWKNHYEDWISSAQTKDFPPRKHVTKAELEAIPKKKRRSIKFG